MPAPELLPGRSPRTPRDVAWVLLERSPRAYCAVLRRRVHDVQVVRARSDLVLEGFPRSANSFLRESLLAVGPDLEIASHVHQAPHVRRGVELGVPVVVVVREPLPAVASMLLREPERRAEDLLRWYVRFHAGVWPVVERVSLVGFRAATARLPDVMAGIGHQVGRTLAPAGDDHDARVFARLEQVDRERLGSADEHHVARPSAARNESAATIREALRASVPLQHLVREAEDWYARFRDRHGTW